MKPGVAKSRGVRKGLAVVSSVKWPLLLGATMAFSLNAQQTIGTVSTANAVVSGTVTVQQSTATIQSNGTIAAGHQSAKVSLTRGGEVTVCMGSTVQLSQGTAAKSPLLFALNKGAVEIKAAASASDSILTPDLRFDLSNAAPLDLRIRVTPEGDTCVENRGKDAPVLHITEQFGPAGYFVKPNQRVLFEHGSLREVVDRETSSCGCPQASTTLNGNTRFPFPEAVSQGLEEPTVPQAAPGATHTTISTSVSYNGKDATVPGSTQTNPASAPATTPEVPKAESGGHNPFTAIGRFFKRIFGG